MPQTHQAAMNPGAKNTCANRNPKAQKHLVGGSLAFT